MAVADLHERYRELISDRLDRPLPAAEGIDLREHLATCSRCRMVEREYRRARSLLRALPERPAPRDLWARTAAALDREMTRHEPRPSRRHRDAAGRGAGRSIGSPALLLSALGSFVLGVAVVGTQLGGAGLPVGIGPRDAAAVPQPTAFQVTSQPLSFVEFTADGLTIYEARVDRACPPGAPECDEITAARRRVVLVPGEDSASDLDLHEAKGRMALLTNDSRGNDTVSVVFLPPPELDLIPGIGRPDDAPPASTTPGSTDAAPSLEPPTTPPDPSDDPVRPTKPPKPTTSSDSSPTLTTDPNATVVVDPPTDTSPPRSGDPTGTADPPTDPVPPASPSPSESPATVQAVLSDVHVVGSPPAWSSDGETLAFSAMPADRSRGPDIYTWRLGD
ncbi:MAG: zf-HC2 domain-containing protein, partial [Candidatus Limnocylindrales bacterium]